MRLSRIGISLCVGVALAFSLGLTRADPPAGKEHPFDKNVKVTVSDDALIVESNGIPTHATGTFPNATNPNRIREQSYRFIIPRTPKKAKETTRTPLGPIGVAINGVPFYNPYNAEGRDAVFGPNAEIFDSCCGHPDPMGRYHYHKYPVCLKSPFKDLKDGHSPLLGLMFDGYALFGPNGPDGKPAVDLDDCNGHEDPERGYHYHVTAKFPYLIGSYRGVIETRNIDRPRFAGRNGPFTKGQGSPTPPAEAAIDKNGDGILSAAEIEDAPKALLTLDKNGDGILSREELRPARPGTRKDVARTKGEPR
jgi:YHYH protein/EF hand